VQLGGRCKKKGQFNPNFQCSYYWEPITLTTKGKKKKKKNLGERTHLSPPTRGGGFKIIKNKWRRIRRKQEGGARVGAKRRGWKAPSFFRACWEKSQSKYIGAHWAKAVRNFRKIKTG